MAFEYFQNNPSGKAVGDCVVRAISVALGESWDKTYIALALHGFLLKDLPNSDSTWGSYLISNGFKRRAIPDSCPDCFTVGDFAVENPKGTYVLGTGTHAVAIIDGTVMDAWDSTHETPIFYYEKV